MPAWHSLYLSCDDAGRVTTALKEGLTSLGYTLYNPFGMMPGLSYPRMVRLFVAPASEGWTRVIGEPDARLLPALSSTGLCLSAALDGGNAQIAVYADGVSVDPGTALAAQLKPGRPADDLARVFAGAPPDLPPLQSGEGARVVAVPLDALPDDIQEMAQGVNLKQAGKMFDKLSGQLMKGADTEAAGGLLANDGPDWNSDGGRRIRALMACLNVPEGWREPDFVALRDAYQNHARRQRKPNAMLYPGDAEAMAAVPDALDYTPVYGGMKA